MYLRAARHTDAAKLAQVQYASIGSLADLLPDAYMQRRSAEGLQTLWMHELAARVRKTFVAESDTAQVCGFVTFGPANDEDLSDVTAGEIVRLYLAPHWIGQGAGAELLSCATTALKNGGYDPIILWVFEANIRARKFYEKHGFAFDSAFKSEDGMRMMRYARLDG